MALNVVRIFRISAERPTPFRERLSSTNDLIGGDVVFNPFDNGAQHVKSVQCRTSTAEKWELVPDDLLDDLLPRIGDINISVAVNGDTMRATL